jgi:hypothetical protein
MAGLHRKGVLQIDAILSLLLKVLEKIDDGRRGENSNN